jgi:hypothetical protein
MYNSSRSSLRWQRRSMLEFPVLNVWYCFYGFLAWAFFKSCHSWTTVTLPQKVVHFFLPLLYECRHITICKILNIHWSEWYFKLKLQSRWKVWFIFFKVAIQKLYMYYILFIQYIVFMFVIHKIIVLDCSQLLWF